MTTTEVTWLPAREAHTKLFRDKCHLNTFYLEIKKGTIPHIRVGWKIFVPSNALEQMAKAQPLEKGE